MKTPQQKNLKTQKNTKKPHQQNVKFKCMYYFLN